MNKRNIIVKTISYTLTVLMAAAFIFFVDMGWNVKEVKAAGSYTITLTSSGLGANDVKSGSTGYKGSADAKNAKAGASIICYNETNNGFNLYIKDGSSQNLFSWITKGGTMTYPVPSGKEVSDIYLGGNISQLIISLKNHVHAYEGLTCTSGGTCSCGATKDALGHDYTGAEWQTDATNQNHWKECIRTDCPDRTASKAYEGAHAGGTATCEAPAVCATCEKEYGEPLGHSFSYDVVGNKIIAKCSNSGCQYNTTDGITLTLTADEATYSGSPYTGVSIGDWIADGVSVSDVPGLEPIPTTITYKNIEDTEDDGSTTAPTNVGEYTASIDVDGATATIGFEIKPKKIAGLVQPIGDIKFNNDTPNDSSDTTITPTVVVKDGETVLTEGTEENDNDYVLSGATSASAVGGPYTIIVTGKGNYEGTQEVTWNIVDRSFGSGEIVVNDYSDVYDAEYHNIDVKVLPSYGATISYLNPETGTYDTDPASVMIKHATNAGPVTIDYKVEKEGHVTVTGSATVTIDKAPLTLIPKADQSKEYSDPDPVLKYSVDQSGYKPGDNDDNVTLSGNLAYKDQDSAGELEAVGLHEIIGKDEDDADLITAENYKVTVQPGITFEVKRKQIDFDSDTATVTLDFDEKPCTGEEINNDITSIVINGQTLVRDVDFVVSGETSATVFGPHTITITGIGKYDGTANVVWNLTDNTSPDGDIKISETSIKKPFDITAFDWFNKKSQTVTITASDRDSGVDKVYYYASDVIMTEDEVKNISDWTEYKSPFEINPDIKVVVYAKIADKSGNLTFLGSDGLVLDGTDPVIEGIENGMTYCIDAKEITVTDGNLEKVTVNGDEVTLVDGKYTLEAANKKYTVIATDKAGNVTAVVVTINDHHTYGEYVPNNNGNTQSAGTEEAHCIYCDNIDIREIKGTKVDVPVEKSNEESSKIGTGIVKVSVNKDKNCPKATIDNFSTDLATSLLTPAEIQEVADGASAYIFLDIVNIDDKVSSSDKTSVEKIAQGITSGNAKVGMYLDISLFKRLSTALKTDRITNTNGKPIKITLAIPQSLINTNEDINRRYYIARVHDGKASLLDTEYNSDNKTVSCSSELFSTYSLIYVDTAVERDDITVEYHSSNNKVETYTIASPVLLANSLNGNVLAPKTGDDFNIVGWITALFAVILLSGGIVLYERRKSK